MLRVEHNSFLVGLAALKNVIAAQHLHQMLVLRHLSGCYGGPPFAVSFSFQGLASCVLLHLM